MAVLVAGVGYIGAALVERLLDRSEEVVGLENFFSTSRRDLQQLRRRPGFTLVEGSIASPRALEAAFSAAPISTVYLLAAQASANPEAASVRYTEQTNLVGPRILLDCLHHHGVPKVVFGSAFKVYGPNLPPVVDEAVPYGPFGDFSHLSKCYTEKLLEMYAGRYGLTSLAVRLGIVYGASPVMKRDYRFMTAPNKFCLQAVRGETIDLYPGTDLPAGLIHVADAAEAMLAAGEAGFSGYVPINAATELLSIAEVAEAVTAAAHQRGLNVDIRRIGTSGDRPDRRPIVKSRLAGFFAEPRRTVGGSVDELLDYFGRGLT